MSLLIPLAVLFVALILQALFAGYETGFVSSNPIRIRYMAEEEGSANARWLLEHIQKPDRMIAALLIGTNVAVVVSTIVISIEVSSLLPLSTAVCDIISTAIAAPVLLIFAEILPKSVFRTHPNRLALALVAPIRLFYVLFLPLSGPVVWMTRQFLRLMGGSSRHIGPFMTSLEDVRMLVDESADYGSIEPEEREMIHSVIDLQSTQAKEIMVPRIRIRALPDTATRSELAALFEETGLTRIPIYHETIDSIAAVVNAYDLLLDDQPENEDIARFLRDVKHVPDTLRVNDLLEILKSAKQHVAIVTDEYGGTDGLVTVEDIIEEIFGEIQDEYDREENPIYKVGPNAYVVDALAPLYAAADFIGVPIHDEDVETVGGWLMHVAGRIPAQGEVIRADRFQITVLDGTVNHIVKVRLEVLPEAGGKESGGPDRRAELP
ncbi:MAG: HlyC/CorC family transporter [Candidatus Hydrogenedentes bacterium]|nr:HlyC/CorC family transporter [Candidatus Hydrogenedentota bacterium]